ncbi:hypothetical protein [Alkalihalophilus marmarensis]|uniref:hypothetical protein n=1 Tax=Alkalihalophilus marmarensis TaxID=521377 RepID=UPI002E1C9A26|nr:hypothetical protein [Alkalihalophilus marmarensis]
MAELNFYKQSMLQTIKETYPKYRQENILKELQKEGLIYVENPLITVDDSVDITDVPEEEQLVYSVQNSDTILKKVEDFEIKSSYSYSAIFSMSEYPAELLEQLKERNVIKNYSLNNDALITDINNISPSYCEVDSNTLILKFSRLLNGFLPIEGDNKRQIKYPIIAVLYQDLNILEIRFEKVRGFLKNNDEYFYHKQITLVKSWVEEYLATETEALNLSPVIEYITQNEDKEVYVSAQAMNLKSKKKAILDTGENDEDVLPLLGELKALIKENQEKFDENPDIKDLLENFILETEQSSDLPWISLTWKNESKSKAIKIKFQFNYLKQDYSLLQYYGNKTEMERMNYVTRYLIENKTKCDEDFETEEFGENDQSQTG